MVWSSDDVYACFGIVHHDHLRPAGAAAGGIVPPEVLEGYIDAVHARAVVMPAPVDGHSLR